MLAPTSLPSWWAFNEAVLQALAGGWPKRRISQFSGTLAVLLGGAKLTQVVHARLRRRS